MPRATGLLATGGPIFPELLDPSPPSSSATPVPSTPRQTREAHVAALVMPTEEGELSDLQQYLDWPTTTITEEFDRRKSLFKMVEQLEKSHFKEFTQKAKQNQPKLLDRLRYVRTEALKTSTIPRLREQANLLLAELKKVEDSEGHHSRDFLVTLHDFHNHEILLYRACLRSEALYDFLDLLEDEYYEGGDGKGAKGRLPRPRFL